MSGPLVFRRRTAPASAINIPPHNAPTAESPAPSIHLSSFVWNRRPAIIPTQPKVVPLIARTLVLLPASETAQPIMPLAVLPNAQTTRLVKMEHVVMSHQVAIVVDMLMTVDIVVVHQAVLMTDVKANLVKVVINNVKVKVILIVPICGQIV